MEPHAVWSGSVSSADEAAARRWDDLRVDDYLRFHFGVEPVLAAEPLTPRDDAEPDDDEQFAAYMRQHFPTAL